MEAKVIRKDLIVISDGEWEYLNNYMNLVSGAYLLKRGMNKRYRVEMYEVNNGFRTLLLDKREQSGEAAALPFDMVSGIHHFSSFHGAHQDFKRLCKIYRIESCEVTRYFRWQIKYG